MKIYILSFILVCVLCKLYGQESKNYGVINARIINQSARPVNNSESADVNLNALLKDYNVYSYRFSFPHSKYPQLQNIIEIQCNCDAQKLSEEIIEKAGNLLTDIRIPEIDKPDVDPPDDYLYTLAIDSPNRYLWHLPKIEAQSAWDITKGSSNMLK